MGKRNQKWRNKNKNKRSNNKVIQAGRNSDFVTQTVAQGNPKFEAYYAVQGLHHTKADGSKVGNFEEWNNERIHWRTTLGKVLPASFRFCLYDKLVPVSVKQEMETQVQNILQKAQAWDKDTWEQQQEIQGNSLGKRKKSEMHTPITYENLQPHQLQLTKLPFGDYCYQLQLDKNIIRKHPALKELHQWLMQHTDCGHVTRQEAVSMIPPIVLLNTPPTTTPTNQNHTTGQSIFDMCAAPGSKTSQLLEGLATLDTHDQLHNLLVANDVNPSRAHMLTHQLKRILGHYPAALMTAAPAQHFPASRSVQGKFDKLLADVPCSGDGTTRKNIGVWKEWSQLGALGLHKLQHEIAWKGVSTLLKMGGYMCYSTCSLNPIEDEAVVAELLRKSKGNLELVDIHQSLGGFVTRPGVSDWKVLCEPLSKAQQKSRDRKNTPRMQAKRAEYEAKQEQEQKNEEAAAEDDAKELATNGESTKATETPSEPPTDKKMEPLTKFEPTSMDPEYLMEQALATGLVHVPNMEEAKEKGLDNRIQSSNFPPTPEEAAKFQLHRCIRVVSHDNNTGGFFVALLKKTGPIGGSDFKNVRQAAEAEANGQTVVEMANDDVEEEEDANTAEPEAKRIKVDEDGDAAVEDPGETETPTGEDEDDAAANDTSSNNNNRKIRFSTEFHTVDAAILDPLLEYYGLTGPHVRKDLFMNRSGGDTKNIFWVAPCVKDLFDAGMNIQNRVNIISTGLKAFTRNNTLKDCEVSHRLAQDAIQFLVPHMSDKRKFSVSFDDFERCLNGNTMMKMEEFSADFRSRARGLDLGCFVVILEGYEERLHEKMIGVMWRCKGDHVNTLVSKPEKDGLLTKLAVLKEEHSAEAKPAETS